MTFPAAPRLTATDLACRRGSRELFKGLAFDVTPGQLIWIRGHNGRGKTSLLRLLAGLIAPAAASRRRAPVRTLSQGQRRRVALARLAVDVAGAAPTLWLLDEPFDALDVDGVRGVDELLAEQLRRGGSVLLSSHLPVNPALGAIEIDLDAHG